MVVDWVQVPRAAAVPLSYDADSPNYARNVRKPIVPTGRGAREPNAKPNRTADAVAVTVDLQGRTRRMRREERAQLGHRRKKRGREVRRCQTQQPRPTALGWSPSIFADTLPPEHTLQAEWCLACVKF
jgi:hypothetical protein